MKKTTVVVLALFLIWSENRLASHRLADASIVDWILVFSNGRILVSGTHDELYKSKDSH